MDEDEKRNVFAFLALKAVNCKFVSAMMSINELTRKSALLLTRPRNT